MCDTRENSFISVSKSVKEGGVSSFGAVCNILTTAVGVGMLALPNAIAQAGYVPGFIMFVFCVGVALVCCWLLKEAMWMAIDMRQTSNPDEPVTTYADIGSVAYGKIGQWSVAFALHSALMGCSCLIALLMGKALNRLIPSVSVWLWIIISCSVMLPFVWLRTMKHLGLVSATFGTASIVALTITVVVAGFMYIGWSDPAYWIAGNPTRHYDAVGEKFWGIGTAFGTLTFAFAVTCTLPTILNDMSKKADAAKVIGYGVAATSVVYSLVALCGYLGFGSLLVVEGVDNIFAVLEKGTAIATCTDILVLLVCITHYAVMINPSCRAFESLFPPKVSENVIYSCLLRTGLVIVTALVAIFAGKFTALVDLIGSISFALVHMVFPPIFYLKLRTMMGHSVWSTRREKFLTTICIVLVVLACFGGAIGSISSIIHFIG
jgi:amino acid permease